MSQRQPKTPIHHEVGIPDKRDVGHYTEDAECIEDTCKAMKDTGTAKEVTA